jgi:hypothetical protein
MAYERKPGDFTLGKNKHKGTNERAPDYKGEGLGLDGQPIEVAAWLKDGANGKFMACRIQAKGERAQQPRPEPARKPNDPGGFENMEDDIPFACPYAGKVWMVV